MKYYKRVDAQGKTKTVESYSHELPVAGAMAIDKVEYDAYIAALPVLEPEKPRDLAAEIDGLKTELKSKGFIA